MNPLLIDSVRDEVRGRVFADVISTIQQEVEEAIESVMQFIVDYLLSTVFSVPLIETEGPLTFGRPDGQPLSAVEDILTPNLFNYIATEAYNYVWLGSGGIITIMSIVLFGVLIVVEGQYEMLQFDTSKKKSKNKFVGVALLIFWFPLYLLIINFAHSTIHAIVEIEHLTATISGVLLGFTTAILGVVSSAVLGAAASGPVGGLLVGIVALGLVVVLTIVIVLPYVLLAIFMFLRSIMIGVFSLFGPVLIAGSYSGLPNISEACDKILWKAVVIAVIPVVLVPFLYFGDLIFFPLFDGGILLRESLGTVIGAVLAFSVMGYVLLIALWVGFSKISPASHRAGQSAMRGIVAAGLIGVASRMGMEASQVGKAAEMTVRVGPGRGAVMVAGGYITNAYFGGQATKSGSEGSGGNDYDQNYDDQDEREGERGGGDGSDGQGDYEDEWEDEWEEDDVVDIGGEKYTLKELQENLYLNHEEYLGAGEWKEAPDLSAIRIEEIVDRAYENGLSGQELDRKFEQFTDDDLPEGVTFREVYLSNAKAAAVDMYDEKYDTQARPQNQPYNLVGIGDGSVDVTSEVPDDVDPLGKNGRVIYDPVDSAFEQWDEPEPEPESESVDEDYDTNYNDSEGDETDTTFGSEDSESTSGETSGTTTESTYDNEDADEQPVDPYEKDRESLAEYLRVNEDATAIDAVANRGVNPAKWKEPVEDALESENPHEALQTPTEYEASAEEVDDSLADETAEDYEQVEESTSDDASSDGEDIVEDVIEVELSEGVEDAVNGSDTPTESDPEATNEADETSNQKESVQNKEASEPLAALSEHRQQEYRSLQTALRDELNKNPNGDISPTAVCGAARAEPSVWLEPIETALESDYPVESVPIPEQLR